MLNISNISVSSSFSGRGNFISFLENAIQKDAFECQSLFYNALQGS